MTEEIDLDELDVASDDEDEPNPGDWFWHGEGDPPEETTAPDEDASVSNVASVPDTGSESEGDVDDAGGETDASARIPHVPRENKDKPVGIPTEGGGAGGDAVGSGDETAPGEGPSDDADGVASGPHGGGIDDMTLALTYSAMKQFAEPLLVVQDARAWADWVGIVGDVEAFVINKFQREHDIDVDFFSGAGQSAAGRLADVGKHSMFYAERMALVGQPEEREIAEQADWEVIPRSEAAEKAGWELADDAE